MLSDLNLPQSNGGFTVIEEMRKTRPRSINFILTSYPADESFRRTNGHDVARCFINPFEIEEMVETIEKKLAAQNSGLMYIATGKEGGLGGRVLPRYVLHFGVRPHNRGHAV